MSFVIAYVTAIYRLFMVNSAILPNKKMLEDVSILSDYDNNFYYFYV